MKDEFRFIERLKSLIPGSLQGTFPIGDDAAVLAAGGGKALLVTTDCIVEGVDFVGGRKGASPEAVGHKALAVNLSDVAAMGGKPLAFVAVFGIPGKTPEIWVERVARGMIRLAKTFGVSWVGGDLTRSDRFFVSIALWGEALKRKVIFRKGARPGDLIYVTGKLGGSLSGKHLSFTPRLAEGRYLAETLRPTSMIDLSDGFIQDLGHLLKASGVGARVALDRIPISLAAWNLSRKSRRKALESALADGEDFELLFTLPKKRGESLERIWPRKFPRLSLTRVGEVRSGRGIIHWEERGKPLKRLWFRKKGFSHF
jgi:thiamine-monophosphate kinase